jgi:hypothetical protein
LVSSQIFSTGGIPPNFLSRNFQAYGRSRAI